MPLLLIRSCSRGHAYDVIGLIALLRTIEEGVKPSNDPSTEFDQLIIAITAAAVLHKSFCSFFSRRTLQVFDTHGFSSS